jgi:hypothetical protein
VKGSDWCPRRVLPPLHPLVIESASPAPVQTERGYYQANPDNQKGQLLDPILPESRVRNHQQCRDGQDENVPTDGNSRICRSLLVVRQAFRPDISSGRRTEPDRQECAFRAVSHRLYPLATGGQRLSGCGKTQSHSRTEVALGSLLCNKQAMGLAAKTDWLTVCLSPPVKPGRRF